MKTKDVRPQSYVKTLRCDRCERTAEIEESEFFEFTSIDFVAGYGSILGDGNRVELDICQHCLKETLGQWLKISEQESGPGKLLLQARLNLFDPEKHGGEFPTQGDT